jgi:pimeloyl-ACP methyl ester carboxylesterase
MSTATINGQQIYFEDTGGDGPSVIFGHGFLMDHEMFAAQVDALRATHRVITFDSRGFGNTVFDGQPFSYWDLANDCLGLLTHLGIERAVVGGMSQGGFVALRVALTAPERVRGLILLDTQAGVERPEVLELYQGMIATWLAVGAVDELAGGVASIIINDADESPRWIAKWQSRPKEFIIEPANCLLTRDDITDRLSEITCAAVVIHGVDDTAIDMERADVLAAGLVGSGAVVAVPGAHASCLTHPVAVNAAIESFLGALAG